jgi:hypothetical protein
MDMEMDTRSRPLDPAWGKWLRLFWYLGLAFWGLFAVLVIAQNF